MTWQYLFSTPGAGGKVLRWLGRSAAIFHFLRLLVVAAEKLGKKRRNSIGFRLHARKFSAGILNSRTGRSIAFQACAWV